MPTILGLTQSAFDPASRFRFIQFIPHLERAGWIVEHRPNFPDRQWSSARRGALMRALHYRLGRALMKINRVWDISDSGRFDVLFVNRDFASEGPWLERWFRSAARRCIFDFDDAIFIGRRERRVRALCRNAFWVTPGNPYLAEYASRWTSRVTIIPTVIDTETYRARDYDGVVPNGSGTLRIGWSGSDQSIRETLIPFLPVLRKLQEKIPFDLVVITNTKPQLPECGLRWQFVPWRASEEALLESRLDVGIMPLRDDAFQKGKCALKLLQYMAAGLPTVASPVGVNRDVIRPGVIGLLAGTPEEWIEALGCLLENRQMRADLGTAGRRLCEQEYSVRRWLPVLVELFSRAAALQRDNARDLANTPV